MVVFGRDDNEAITASYRLSKLANLRRRCVSILVFIVERKRQIQNVERDLVGKIVMQTDHCRAGKGLLAQAAGQADEPYGKNGLVHGQPRRWSIQIARAKSA